MHSGDFVVGDDGVFPGHKESLHGAGPVSLGGRPHHGLGMGVYVAAGRDPGSAQVIGHLVGVGWAAVYVEVVNAAVILIGRVFVGASGCLAPDTGVSPTTGIQRVQILMKLEIWLYPAFRIMLSTIKLSISIVY